MIPGCCNVAELQVTFYRLQNYLVMEQTDHLLVCVEGQGFVLRYGLGPDKADFEMLSAFY